MLSFNQFHKNKEKKEYEIIKSKSNLPILVLPIPDSVDLTTVDNEPEKVPSIVNRVCDFISDRYPINKTKKEYKWEPVQ